MLERDRIIEIIVAVSAVLLMVGIMAGIGITYGDEVTQDGVGGEEFTEIQLSEDGGELLIGAIVGFIVLMLLLGIGLAFALNGPEDGLEVDEDDDAESGNPA